MSSYAVGERVWVKVGNCPFWPSKIVSPDEVSLTDKVRDAKKKKPNANTLVYFYGSHNYDWICPQDGKNIAPCTETNHASLSQLSKSKTFLAAVGELEGVLKGTIPDPAPEPSTTNKSENRKSGGGESPEKSSTRSRSKSNDKTSSSSCQKEKEKKIEIMKSEKEDILVGEMESEKSRGRSSRRKSGDHHQSESIAKKGISEKSENGRTTRSTSATKTAANSASAGAKRQTTLNFGKSTSTSKSTSSSTTSSTKTRSESREKEKAEESSTKEIAKSSEKKQDLEKNSDNTKSANAEREESPEIPKKGGRKRKSAEIEKEQKPSNQNQKEIISEKSKSTKKSAAVKMEEQEEVGKKGKSKSEKQNGSKSILNFFSSGGVTTASGRTVRQTRKSLAESTSSSDDESEASEKPAQKKKEKEKKPLRGGGKKTKKEQKEDKAFSEGEGEGEKESEVESLVDEDEESQQDDPMSDVDSEEEETPKKKKRLSGGAASTATNRPRSATATKSKTKNQKTSKEPIVSTTTKDGRPCSPSGRPLSGPGSRGGKGSRGPNKNPPKAYNRKRTFGGVSENFMCKKSPGPVLPGVSPKIISARDFDDEWLEGRLSNLISLTLRHSSGTSQTRMKRIVEPLAGIWHTPDLAILNSGGAHAWALDWCPLEDSTGSQFFACSSHPTAETEHSLRHRFYGRNVIQLWEIADLCKPSVENELSMAMCVEHERGFCWDMKWCPAPCNDATRLGLLACAFSDGSLCVYAIPSLEFASANKKRRNRGGVQSGSIGESSDHVGMNSDQSDQNSANSAAVVGDLRRSEAESESEEIEELIQLRLDPVMDVSARQPHVLCSCNWNAHFGTPIVLAGASNGSVYAWELSGHASFSPLFEIRPAMLAIRSLSPLDLDPHYFQCVSNDGSFACVDMRDPGCPVVSTTLQKEWITDLCAPDFNSSTLIAMHDGSVRQLDPRETGFTRIYVNNHNLPVWSVHMSPDHRQVILGSSDGRLILVTVHNNGLIKSKGSKPLPPQDLLSTCYFAESVVDGAPNLSVGLESDLETYKLLPPSPPADQPSSVPSTPQANNGSSKKKKKATDDQNSDSAEEETSATPSKKLDTPKNRSLKKEETPKIGWTFPHERTGWTKVRFHPNLAHSRWILCGGASGMIVLMRTPPDIQ